MFIVRNILKHHPTILTFKTFVNLFTKQPKEANGCSMLYLIIPKLF